MCFCVFVLGFWVEGCEIVSCVGHGDGMREEEHRLTGLKVMMRNSSTWDKE